MRRNSRLRIYRKTMGIRRAPAFWIVVIGALGLLVGILSPTDATAVGQRADYLVKAAKERPVPVAPVKGKAAKVPRMARWSAGQAHKTWPAKGTAEVAVPAQGAARTGDVPVTLAPAKGAHRAVAGARLKVSLPGQTAAQKLGLHGVVLTIRPDRATSDGTVQVGLN